MSDTLRLLINFQGVFQQPPPRPKKKESASLPHTTNTLSIPLSLPRPPLLLAESPPVGRCTLRWQPKCQPALHMPASAVPAYSCHSPPGFSWPALPKSVPPLPPPSILPHTLITSSPTHTPPQPHPSRASSPSCLAQSVSGSPAHIHSSYLPPCASSPPPTPPSPLQPFSHLAPSSDLHLFFSHLSKRHPGCPALFFPETSL